MPKNLVIVESPAKAKTIEKFLGSDYKVMPSYGHIRDLKKKDFSIDFDNDFAPIYEIPSDKVKVVSDLKSQMAKSECIWLASDEDREGEAISWHLAEVLGLKSEEIKRIVFHEITKSAILQAIEHPRNLDQNLVNAQQARRVLDRLVGFELSPVLWKKVKPSLSAGRVQSVTVKLVVEREREIQAFKAEPSFRITAQFHIPEDGKDTILKAEIAKRFKKEEDAIALLERCKDARFTITDISKHPIKKSPAPPFTTSTLQQEASRKLGLSVSQTMMIAQHLYESGKITYMRTDSVNLSSLAINTAKETITNLMGKEYAHPRQFSTKTKGAQEAHEAIRPTYLSDTAIEGTQQEKRLYDLIWKRTIASQMSEAKIEKTSVSIGISSCNETFLLSGETILFDGFLRVYKESLDDDKADQEEESTLLPSLSIGQEVILDEMAATERFTQQPYRYTEASLVRKLEELGIGRPSTYAPTISTILQREYVEKADRAGEKRKYDLITLKDGKIKQQTKQETTLQEKGKLVPTDIGLVVNDFLQEHFPSILDYNFTATIEKDFDDIAEGKAQWNDAIRSFYKDFHPMVQSAMTLKSEHKVGERILGNDPVTGKLVSVKIGRFGPMAQIGSAQDEDKPRFAQLKKNMSIETITLEEALELFKLPRKLGELDGKTMTVGAGRFGPYIYYNQFYTSIPKDKDPLTLSYEEAVILVKAKMEADTKKHIKSFEKEPGLEILNGRFGPYITFNKSNYKIPKDKNPQDLTLEECKAIIEEADKKPAKPKAHRFAKKKTI